MKRFLWVAAAVFLLNACDGDGADYSAWTGKWTGVEGTSLLIEPRAGDGYTVTITDLDGPQRFDAQAEAAGLVFMREGVRETIVATDGAGTGMKWLADKKDCLAVRKGEGFCRD